MADAVMGILMSEEFKEDFMEQQLQKIYRGKVLDEELPHCKRAYLKLLQLKKGKDEENIEHQWLTYNCKNSYVRYVLRLTGKQLPWPEWKFIF
jgi:hypothetical protein